MLKQKCHKAVKFMVITISSLDARQYCLFVTVKNIKPGHWRVTRASRERGTRGDANGQQLCD